MQYSKWYKTTCKTAALCCEQLYLLSYTNESQWIDTIEILIRRRIFNVAQSWYNVVSTLFQHSINVKAISNSIEPVMTTDFLNSWIVFIPLNEIFFPYINNSNTKNFKKYLAVVHVVIHNSGKSFDIHRSMKYCIKISL